MSFCWVPTTPLTVTMPAYLNLTAASLSILGSLTILVCHWALRRSTQKLAHLVACLAFADFCASLIVAISQSFVLVDRDSQSGGVCIWFRALLQYFFLASFFWTSCIAIFLLRAIRQQSSQARHYIIMHVVSWVTPGIFVAISLLLNSFERNPVTGYCEQDPLSQSFLWFLPLGVTLVFNSGMYCIIYSHSKQSIAAKRRGSARQLSLFLAAFVFCWVWDVINFVVDRVDVGCRVWPIIVLQSLCVPLTGFINFLVYGVSTKLFSKQRQPSTEAVAADALMAGDRNSVQNRFLLTSSVDSGVYNYSFAS